jgi:uncharacterized protein
MEASATGPRGAGTGGREADIAPAPAPTEGRSAGWTPADPGPLGLAGFAMTTFVLSMYNANLINIGGKLVVLSLALAYGGIAQLLAGMWEFRTGNTFGAVAFSSFGAFWLSYFFLVQFVIVPKLVAPGTVDNAIAVYLYGWAIFTTYMFVASVRTTAAVAAVFLLLAITFWILAIGQAQLSGTVNTTNSTIKLGGWFGLATAAVAWYASFAAVTNSTFGRVVLPVVPLRKT